MTAKWNMIVDVALCENCQNCVLTNKDEHVDQAFAGYAGPMPKHGAEWIQITRRTRGSGHQVDASYLVTMCNHCDNAPCVAAGRGAVKKRPDGLVVIDPQAARGRQDLVASCPYGQIFWNAAEQIPQAWTFDAHLLDQGWQEPRASHACPTQALRTVKVEDDQMRALAARDGLQVLDPEKGTAPRVWYRNLHRHTRDFLAGTVLHTEAGVEDIVEGAEVTLSTEGKILAVTRTDAFGDFKFDGLAADGQTLQLQVQAPQGTAKRILQMAGTTVLEPIHL